MKPGAKQISCSRLLRGFVNIDHGTSLGSTLPLYLCPAAARCPTLYRSGHATTTGNPGHRLLPLRQARKLHLTSRPKQDDDSIQPTPSRTLPVQCAGCGALSQTAVPDEPGYFNLDRRAVKAYLGLLKEEQRQSSEDEILQDALRNRGDLLEQLGLANAALPKRPKAESSETPEVPFCDRCHNLIHHHTGTPIYHPTIEAIRETIQESPYKYNHVYHVLDAADFPMSLLPQVHQLLDLMPLRTKNRRSQSGKFFKGKKTEMSFIITRSDLLAPKKEQVDRLMPTLVDILRHALPRDSRHVRLGNVRCVSAKRSWWTQEVKEDIWKRGGAGWMVGKVNVGKSQLFDAVFPKGRMDWKESKHDISVAVQPRKEHALEPVVDDQEDVRHAVLPDIDDLGDDSLLPPPQEETNFPRMPVVSALPGTTASPIRVPFGGGKGELIDLPGLERSELENWVREEHRPSLVMKARASPEQHVIKPGQSLLIGGFIRITPRTPDLIFLGYAFTPIEPHLTATEKAIEIQQQTSGINAGNISVPGTGEKIKHAGSFKLQWDVTKKRAGPITRKDAAGIKVDRLPYRVLSLDILIEGCGWVEITAQVRTKNLFAPPPSTPPKSRPSSKKDIKAGREEILQELDLSDPGVEEENSQHADSGEPEPNWPVVDVFSPEGRFIGCRPPLNAWLYNKVRKTAETSKKRPRKSMTGAKRRDKDAGRARSAEAW